MEAEILNEIINGNLDKIPPDMIMKAKRLMDTRAGREMLKDLQKKGIDQEYVNKMIEDQKPIIVKKSVLVIRPNGIIKSKLVGEECPLQGSDIQFIIIKLNNQNVIAWYDQKIKTTNKRASKILNMKVGGMVVLCGEGDITMDILK